MATLLHEAGVEFTVLGEGETCTGDPARRMGHEFLFQMLAQQNVETLNEAGATRSWSPARTASTRSRNEYPQLGGHYEVVHHTELLAQLVADGRLAPVEPVARRSPTTTPATWAGTTGSSPRPASCSAPCRGSR